MSTSTHTPAIYLFFKGQCSEAMSRYAEVLGWEQLSIDRNRDAPTPKDRMEGDDDTVMNVVMRAGDALVMASDAPAAWYDAPKGFRVQLAPKSRTEFDRLFAALGGDGASVEMPPAETFFAERFTMFTDRFGTPWMLNFEGAKAQSPSAGGA